MRIVGRWIAVSAVLAGLLGCGTEKLDTGYTPRKLGASEALRRSYYAAPFTPEAKVPDQDREPQFDRNRPRTY